MQIENQHIIVYKEDMKESEGEVVCVPPLFKLV